MKMKMTKSRILQSKQKSNNAGEHSKESAVLNPPTFSLGLTQDQPNESTALNEENLEENLNQEKNDREQEEEQGEEVEVADNVEQRQRKSEKGRVRMKSKPGKVWKMVDEAKKNSSTYRRKEAMLSMCEFSGILEISNWKEISTKFVKWVVKNFEKDHGPQIRLSETEVLKLTEDDVSRVYNLPRGARTINLIECTDESIQRLRDELGLGQHFERNVKCVELESCLKTLNCIKTWTKAAILYIIYCLLCPCNNSKASLKYAHILEDLESVRKYNWCRHVLDHLSASITPSNTLSPSGDMHFLLINFLERMGIESRLFKGDHTVPSLRGWDVHREMAKLEKLHDWVGLSRVVAVGVTKERITSNVTTICLVSRLDIKCILVYTIPYNL